MSGAATEKARWPRFTLVVGITMYVWYFNPEFSP